MRYWYWLLRGLDGGKAGLSRFADAWLLLHIIVGASMAVVVPVSLARAADSVLLPLVGILIGLSFAWGGNANAILQTSEILDISKYHPGGLQEYVYVYTTAILVLLSGAILWGLAAFEIFDAVWPRSDSTFYFFLEWFAYGFSSIALRECWHVVVGAQYLLLMRAKARELDPQNHDRDG